MSVEEGAHPGSDPRSIFLQGEMPRVQQTELERLQVALVGVRALSGKDLVVLPRGVQIVVLRRNRGLFACVSEYNACSFGEERSEPGFPVEEAPCASS